MNWSVLKRPSFWVDLALALTLLAFGLRAHTQTVPTPDALEQHLEFNDRRLNELEKQFRDIDEKVSEMWGIGVAASALAMGSVVLHFRK